jgi:hypothetical protein
MDHPRDPFEQDGFLVLFGAAPADAIAAYAEELPGLRDGLLVRAPGDEHPSLAAQAQPGVAGAIDPYAISPAARAVLVPDAVVATLTSLYGGDAPLLFDAAETEAGAPDDGAYRDATYTAVARQPESLITAVVALADDVNVVVYPGSQGIATMPFSGRYRHFNAERDGDAALARHREELAEAVRESARETITLAAGDVLLVHADLIHEAPRGHGLVAHLCPARVTPAWFAYRPERARHAAVGAAWIATQHYDLVDAVEPERGPQPDAGPEAQPAAEAEPEPEPELELVTEAMREHDEDARAEDAPGSEASPVTQPPPGQRDEPGGGPPRRRGLVKTVRGFIRRGNR